jgi:serine/threonine-protein kinase
MPDDSSILDRLKKIVSPDELLSDEPSIRNSSIVGRFILLDKIGEGGMGEVWRAEDPSLGREVALKVLARVSGSDLDRFLREGRVAAKLNHPAIVPVHEMGAADGRYYISMQLVKGGPIEGRGLPARKILEVMALLADAVHYAHQQGVVHRDIKPRNVLLADDGRVFLTDFGLAKPLESPDLSTSRAGSVLGTPAYMSPEQARGQPATPRSDVYSLGATLYALLAGKAPFESVTLLDTLQKVSRDEPAPLVKVAADIRTIVAKAMEKEPERRYASAADFAADLRRALNSEPIAARPPSLAYRAYRRIRRNWIAYAALAAVLAAVVLGWGGSIEHAERLKFMRETADQSVREALRLRREGYNELMDRHLPRLQAVYAEAPELAEVDYLMGRMYRALLNDVKALEHQERALAKDPSYEPALYERLVLKSNRFGRDFQNAAAVLAGRYPAPPLRPDLAREIAVDAKRLRDSPAAQGILAFHEGRLEDARALLQRAVKADPFMEEAWETLGRIEQVQAATAKDPLVHWKRAEDILNQAIEHDRGYLPHWLSRGLVRAARGRYRMLRDEDSADDLLSAERDFTAALRLDPTNEEAWLWRGAVSATHGFLHMSQGIDPLIQFDAAERDLNKSTRPEACLWRAAVRADRALHLAARGEDPNTDYESALADYSKALRLYPSSADAWVWRGATLANRALYRMGRAIDPSGDLDQAEADCSKAIELNANLSAAWSRRGSVRADRGTWRMSRGENPEEDFAAAEKDCARALALDPKNADAHLWRAVARDNRSIWRQSKKEPPLDDLIGALYDYTESLRLHFRNFDAWLRRGILQARLGQWRQEQGLDPLSDWVDAERDLTRAIEFYPGNPEAYSWRGQVRMNLGKTEAAQADFAEAERLRR